MGGGGGGVEGQQGRGGPMRPLQWARLIDDVLADRRAACYLRATTGYGDALERSEVVEHHGGRVVVVLSEEATTALRWMHPESAALMVEAVHAAFCEGGRA
jgi:hypothetical protein